MKKKNHIILTNGRSGSNYLANLLNLHPEATNYGEVLGDWTIPYKIYKSITKLSKNNIPVSDYLDYIFNNSMFFRIAQYYSVYSHIKKKEKTNFKQIKQIKTIGIKDFSINFIKRNIPKYIANRTNLYIINLYRDNSLKRLLSLQLMNITDVVALTNPEERKNLKIQLPIDNLIPELEMYEKEKKEQFELINSSPQDKILNLKYEDYFSSSENQEFYNRKIFDFLGIYQLNLVGKHKKISSNNLSDVIENYDQVAETLKNTKYEQFLTN